jgi:hypothetical protein
MPLLEIYERTTEREIPLLTIPTCTPVDPFGIDHDCDNPAGHQFVATCSDIVCWCCGRIAWQ